MLAERFPALFWVAIVGTGVLAGLAGGGLMVLLRLVQHLAYGYSGGSFLNAVRGASGVRVVGAMALAGVIVVIARVVLRQRSGGHVAELTEAIWFGAGRLSVPRALANAVVSIVIVGLGASLGREAAPKQAAAAAANLLASATRLSDEQRRILVALGAGAGMAAVYNVPFGGALFALEVLLGSLALPLVAPALAASFIATAVSWAMLPDRPSYALPQFHATAHLIVWAVAIGPVLGLVAALYIRLIAAAAARHPRWPDHVAWPLVVFVGLGLLALPLPQLLGNGRDVVALSLAGRIGLPLLLVLAVLKPLATAACLGAGAPGGLFTPTMTVGALVGSVLGRCWPGAAAGSYAVVGAGAMLAAATQAPVSAVVLMMELTWRLDGVVVPLLAAVVGAVAVVRLLERRSIYTSRLKARGSAP